MTKEEEKKKNKLLAWLLGLSPKAKGLAALAAVLLIALCVGVSALFGNSVGGGTELIEKFWPDAFVVKAVEEPPFEDDPSRTNNAFNVIDFGKQGNNGWIFRAGDYKHPERSQWLTMFDGQKYACPGAMGFEIKNNFVHTANNVSPILEWRAAEDGRVNITVSYVKNVNGDANPSYPDGVQLLVYKGKELLKLENVPISTETENFAQIKIEKLPVKELESLYFVVNPRSNNAYDGGSLYVAINDVDYKQPEPELLPRTDNNADSVDDFGRQGSNGWLYMYGNDPGDCKPVSHLYKEEYINNTSPSLTIKKDFIHPSLNHRAVLGWVPAVNGYVDLRIRYTKFEQNDGMPDFPDGTKLLVYKNGDLLHEEDVAVPDKGENMIRYRVPMMYVTPSDRIYVMIDAGGNSSYDGGMLDVTVVDINGTTDEYSQPVIYGDVRQNIANVLTDFGPQGSNGWYFQSGYCDDPFNARNITPFDRAQDRYFQPSWLEIKRDYVNTGTHDSSAIIKWKVAQNGTVSVRASYTKMLNEDSNPSWPDGTRVTLYYNNTVLAQQTFAPDVYNQVTKRLDVPSLNVRQGDFITMVICGIDNNAYDGGKFEFAIDSLSGLVGNTERNVPATYNGKRVNFASTLDDFSSTQGYNGWYYQFGYHADPFFAVNIENYNSNEDKYFTSDGVEIKKDYIVPAANGKSANVKWVVAEDGKINIDLLYTKLLNQDANPSYPDGVTVYLFKNNEVLKQQYFGPSTTQEVTGDLSTYGVSVNAGDCITMIVDPGENPAYDGGKYLFVIEDANKVPVVKVSDNDNDTSLKDLASMDQGTDGWWFLEGTSPSNAKVLTKQLSNGHYGSRRTEGLEMGKDFVHTGAAYDPIYQFLPGEDGNIDISGRYVKFGHESSNPSEPDGVTVKIWKNGTLLISQKVNVRQGDGNDNVLPFNFEKMAVKRGDKISFQICADGNYAWDGGRLEVAIEPTPEIDLKPGDDNETVLNDLSSIAQGTDGWYFMEGTSLSNAKPLTKMNDDSSAYLSKKEDGLEVKKDFVHTGPTLNPIYRWVVKEDGKVDVIGRYVKFGYNPGEVSDPSVLDGVTVYIYQNDKELKSEKVTIKANEDNTFRFEMDELDVKANDIISFRISPNSNNAWDAGKLSVAIMPTPDIEMKPGDDNKTVLSEISSIEQGTDGWYFMEGTSLDDAKYLTKKNNDGSAYVSLRDDGVEVKKDYVHPGADMNPLYRWVVAEDGNIDITGDYVKFGHDDGNPDWPDGITLYIYQNDTEIENHKVEVKKGEDNTVHFSIKELEVKENDVITFRICPDSNNAWDAGRLAVTIIPTEPYVEIANLKEDFNGTPGTNGWYYGMADYDGGNFAELPYDGTNNRYMNVNSEGAQVKPELKPDFVEPGSGRNAAYKWVATQDGDIKVTGEYVKFANPEGTGTAFRIRLNGEEKAFIGMQGTSDTERKQSFEVALTVKQGDELMFLVDPEQGDDAYDGGRITAVISAKESEPADEYTVEYKYDGEYPDEVKETLPTDDTTYADKEEITAKTPDPSSIEVEGDGNPGKWTFNDWTRTEDENVVTFTGTWTFTPYTVIANLKNDFSGTPGTNGWYYGMAGYLGDNFEALPYDGTNNRYMNVNGEGAQVKPELKPDFVEPGSGRNAAYKWVATQSGTVKVIGEYVKFANPEGTGTCFRIRLNGEEKKFIGMQGTSDTERKATFNETIEINEGDVLMFLVDPEGDDAWDSGRLTVSICSESSAPEPEPEPETKYTVTYVYDGDYPEAATPPTDSTEYSDKNEITAIPQDPASFAGEVDGVPGTWTFDGWTRTEDENVVTFTGTWTFTPYTVLADLANDFGGTNGWSYGMADYDGGNFAELPYDGTNNRYMNVNDIGEFVKPELKPDFVEPGSGRNAAYKWVASVEGEIRIIGSYTKYAYNEDGTTGTCFRVTRIGDADASVFINMKGEGSASDRTENFDITLTVSAGDEIMFHVDPEGNDAWDGGKITATIYEVK